MNSFAHLYNFSASEAENHTKYLKTEIAKLNAQLDETNQEIADEEKMEDAESLIILRAKRKELEERRNTLVEEESALLNIIKDETQDFEQKIKRKEELREMLRVKLAAVNNDQTITDEDKQEKMSALLTSIKIKREQICSLVDEKLRYEMKRKHDMIRNLNNSIRNEVIIQDVREHPNNAERLLTIAAKGIEYQRMFSSETTAEKYVTPIVRRDNNRYRSFQCTFRRAGEYCGQIKPSKALLVNHINGAHLQH